MTIETSPVTAAASIARMGRPLTGADIIEALELEIHRQYKSAGGLQAFTAKMGVDYRTYRRYIVGERKMSADMLMDSLAALGVDPIVFFMQLRQRLEAEQG